MQLAFYKARAAGEVGETARVARRAVGAIETAVSASVKKLSAVDF